MDNRRAFDISADIQKVTNDIIETYGEVTETQLQTLDSLRMEMADKAMDICKVKARLDSDLAYWKENKAIADAHCKNIEKTQKFLSDYLAQNMKKSGIEKIKNSQYLYSITLCKGRASVVVDNIDALPIEYIEVVRKPVTKALKEALEKGEQIDGAHLEFGDDYCMIRSSKKKEEGEE